MESTCDIQGHSIDGTWYYFPAEEPSEKNPTPRRMPWYRKHEKPLFMFPGLWSIEKYKEFYTENNVSINEDDLYYYDEFYIMGLYSMVKGSYSVTV